MFGIGMGEFLGLVILGLFLVGPDKLPEAAKTLPDLFTRFATSQPMLRVN